MSIKSWNKMYVILCDLYTQSCFAMYTVYISNAKLTTLHRFVGDDSRCCPKLLQACKNEHSITSMQMRIDFLQWQQQIENNFRKLA